LAQVAMQVWSVIAHSLMHVARAVHALLALHAEAWA
jgi:hypothetical protein